MNVDFPSAFCPMPYRYGAMRIDPVASVQRLNDPIAEEEARNLQTQCYLVYLYHELALPFPGMPWFPYVACPIGTGLRPADPEGAITPDMCVPIYPNEAHPAGREPLRTIPEFPFVNCYHWIQFGLDVRIRAKHGDAVFDGTHSVALPVRQRMALSSYWEEDHCRVDSTLKKRRKKAEQLALANQAHSGGGGGVPSTSDDLSSGLSSTNSDDSDDSRSDDAEAGTDDSGSIGGIDVFGIAGMQGFNGPLVDFSFDIREAFDADSIPSPVDLYAEFETLEEIIARAHDRRARESACHESIYTAEAGSEHPEEVQTSQPTTQLGEGLRKVPRQRERPRVVQTLHRWKASTRAVAAAARRIRHMLRLPYLLVWA